MKLRIVVYLLVGVTLCASEHQSKRLISRSTMQALIAQSPVLQAARADLEASDSQSLSGWYEAIRILASDTQLKSLEKSYITSCSQSEQELGISKLTLRQQTALLELLHKLDMSDAYKLCEKACVRRIKKHELLFAVSPSLGLELKTNPITSARLLKAIMNNIDLSGLFRVKKTTKRAAINQEDISPDGQFYVEITNRPNYGSLRVKIRAMDQSNTILYKTTIPDCIWTAYCWSKNQRYVYIATKKKDDFLNEGISAGSTLYVLDLEDGSCNWRVSFASEVTHMITSENGDFTIALSPEKNMMYVINNRLSIGIKHTAHFHAKQLTFSDNGTYLYIQCPNNALRINFSRLQAFISCLTSLSLEQALLAHVLIAQRNRAPLTITYARQLWKSLPKIISERIDKGI